MGMRLEKLTSESLTGVLQELLRDPSPKWLAKSNNILSYSADWTDKIAFQFLCSISIKNIILSLNCLRCSESVCSATAHCALWDSPRICKQFPCSGVTCSPTRVGILSETAYLIHEQTLNTPTPRTIRFLGGQVGGSERNSIIVAIIVFYSDLPHPSLYNDNIKDPNNDVAVDVSNTIITIIW